MIKKKKDYGIPGFLSIHVVCARERERETSRRV